MSTPTPISTPSNEIEPSIDGGFLDHLASVRDRAVRWLVSQQQSEGYWCAELQGDVILETEYFLFLRYMGFGTPEIEQALARYVLSQRNAEGGWGLFPGAPSELSATVKAYVMLKALGHDPESPLMREVRAVILRHGGIVRVNSFTKIQLALAGLYDWNAVPAIPPELILFPKNFYFSIYSMSAWSRTMIVPLAIVAHYKKTVPLGIDVDELYVGGREKANPHMLYDKNPLTWHNFFLVWNRIIKVMENLHIHPLRPLALWKSHQWLRDRIKHSEGLGTIFPALVNSMIAFHALGYSHDDPVIRREHAELERFYIWEGDKLRLQPCFSPVWDTGWAALALRRAGLASDDPSIVKSVEWLLTKETRLRGDWAIKNPLPEPSGWYFEYKNEWYPDVDDTTLVLRVLNLCEIPNQAALARASERGLDWLMGMQCRGGGWAAFDKDNDKTIFTKVPFADHNAMIDPPTADITGRVLELLGELGFTADDPSVAKAISFIRSEQERDGSWFGRWGVNYIYGTWQVLVGLASVGENMKQPYVQRAARWLRSVQKPDGGWGESLASYEEPHRKNEGASTASQTAWAVLGLIAVGESQSPAVLRGLRYLAETQTRDGDWSEDAWTGTGFPKVFYLRYHYYRHYFPLLAIGTWFEECRRLERGRGFEASTSASVSTSPAETTLNQPA
ncbi:MAG: squalene--hopene cyclase [Verrucomicrobiae bacterium]|nr:squalene--hopene cyclase [Verrucomicrobiae bacterium]